MMARMRIALVPLLYLLGCATAPKGPPPVVDPRPLVTAGPRCQGEACACREVDAYGSTVGETTESSGSSADTKPSPEGAIAGKRFELRTGRGSDDVRITVEGRGTLTKPSEPINAACGYIDLPPGKHRVHVAIKGGASEGGASPKLLIYEYAARTRSWYATFGITCGETGPCTQVDVAERMKALEARHGLFDPCGSTKIRELRWTSTKGPDQRVTTMDLDFTLDVYKFEPRFPRGGACKGPLPE
jgi:hypothetical protein